jgi:hypothetical protein
MLRLTNNTLIVMKKIIMRHEPISIDICEPHRHTARMSKTPTQPTPRRKPSLCSHPLARTRADLSLELMVLDHPQTSIAWAGPHLLAALQDGMASE